MKKQTIAFHIACCVAACLMTACSGNGVPYFADDEPIEMELSDDIPEIIPADIPEVKLPDDDSEDWTLF